MYPDPYCLTSSSHLVKGHGNHNHTCLPVDPVALRCAERKHQKRAAGIIGAMSSAVYRPLVRLVGWLFFWTFGKLFGRLDIQQSHMGMLLHAQKVLLRASFFER